MDKKEDAVPNLFGDLVAIMHRLRSECPWDREQNLDTLKNYLLEEAYECLQAMDEIKSKGPTPLIEELGDLLLQVLFQSEIISEIYQDKNIQSVLLVLKEKLIRRHPHIFTEAKSGTAKEILEYWEAIKRSEKKTTSELGDLSFKGPALLQAYKWGEKSSRVRFDWDKPEEVWQQVLSELKELEEAESLEDKEEELGDLLFCLAQWARHLQIQPERALQKANQKFIARFLVMEEIAKEDGKSWKDLTRDEKETLWSKAKVRLRTS